MKTNKFILYLLIYPVWHWFFMSVVLCQDTTSWDAINPLEEEVIATFKTTRLVNAHSIETVGGKELDFRISHRFGNMFGNTGGINIFYGFDDASDIRFALEYGITNRLTIAFARNKGGLLDGHIKYGLLKQKEGNKIPLSICLLLSSTLNTAKDDNFNKKYARRINYLSQLIIARKMSHRISLEILPTLLYRNYVISSMYDDSLSIISNEPKDKNLLFSIGIGGRVKISKRVAIIVDYFYNFSDYQSKFSEKKFTSPPLNLKPFFNPLGIGIEIETGGHVFHITYTNADKIIENEFLTTTHDSWTKGEIKIGFTISRVFSFRKE